MSIFQRFVIYLSEPEKKDKKIKNIKSFDGLITKRRVMELLTKYD
jgi:hypothetical protein